MQPMRPHSRTISTSDGCPRGSSRGMAGSVRAGAGCPARRAAASSRPGLQPAEARADARWRRRDPAQSISCRGRAPPDLLLPGRRPRPHQGIAEPFPISSLGHGVILPRLAGWHIHQNDKFFLTFLIATHLATAIVLLLFFLQRLGADRQGPVALAARCARSATTTPTRGSAGCSWSARSRSASSACCCRTRCASCSPRRSWPPAS